PISLSLPIQSQPLKGDPVVNYFDNLLPDLTSTRKNIQRRYNTDSTEVFDLLHAIGSDCVGSLSLLPGNEVHNGLTSTQLEP
ncbi:HipA N-terminal domain-containing protein, partial [Vibrio cholerae]